MFYTHIYQTGEWCENQEVSSDQVYGTGQTFKICLSGNLFLYLCKQWIIASKLQNAGNIIALCV